MMVKVLSICCKVMAACWPILLLFTAKDWYEYIGLSLTWVCSFMILFYSFHLFILPWLNFVLSQRSLKLLYQWGPIELSKLSTF